MTRWILIRSEDNTERESYKGQECVISRCRCNYNALILFNFSG
jgi:hypothetical protein